MTSATEQRADVLGLVQRLTALVERENELVRGDPAADLSRFVEAKNRCMYELEIALQTNRAALDKADTRQALTVLKETLAANETLLKAQIAAVGDAIGVVEKLSGAVPDDGTYGNPARRKPAAYL